MTIRIEGLEQAQRAFKQRLQNVNTFTPKALREVAFDLLGKSKELAPIDTGDLRGSGFAEINKNEATIGYTEPYALRQHEELSYNHPQGGQAKYLEEPFVKNTPKYIKHLADSIRKAVD